MRKRFASLFFAATAIVFISSCKKDDSSSGNNNTNFNPITVGSTWTYKHTETNASAYSFTLTATSRDTSANGKTYKVLTNSVGPNTYLAKVGNDDYRFASFPAVGISSFEELFLKEDKNLNDTWSSSTNVNFSGVALIANLTYTIKGKGESRTVNGKSFNNVTHVRLDLGLFNTNVGGGDFYYQDGVGMIEDIISVNITSLGQPIVYSSQDQIDSYVIK